MNVFPKFVEKTIESCDPCEVILVKLSLGLDPVVAIVTNITDNSQRAVVVMKQESAEGNFSLNHISNGNKVQSFGDNVVFGLSDLAKFQHTNTDDIGPGYLSISDRYMLTCSNAGYPNHPRILIDLETGELASLNYHAMCTKDWSIVIRDAAANSEYLVYDNNR